MNKSADINKIFINVLEKEKKYLGLMTTEEGKKIKQKNEELSTEIIPILK